MAIQATYRGKFDFLQLYFGLDFIGVQPKFKVDTKHDRVSFIDPDNAKNSIVLNADHLKVDKNGDITGGTITDIHFKVASEEAITITGLHASAAKLQTAFENGLSGLYPYLVGALSGKVQETGDQFDNFFEVGPKGKATIDAGAGNDRLYVWHQKDIVYDGGGDADQLIFDRQMGQSVMPGHGVTLDLKTGEGTNPYGGTLLVKNVENVTGTLRADTLSGSNKDDILYGGLDGNDVISGRDGSDTISVAGGFDGKSKITADGGTGKDTLVYDISFVTGTHTFDVTKPTHNTGLFGNDKITGFENFTFNDFRIGTERANIHFIGSGHGETVICARGDDIIDAGGGNDTMSGGFGENLFIFRRNFGDDTINDFGLDTAVNTIQFDHNTFADFDAMKAHATQSNFDVIIDAGADGSLRLKDFDVDDLQTGNFSFV